VPYNIEDEPLPENELLKRIDHLHEVVFPGIADGTRARQASMISNFHSKIADIPSSNGSFVMAEDPLSTAKLQPSYEDPFLVVRRAHGGTFVLQDATGTLTPQLRSFPIETGSTRFCPGSVV
jgi:hypothetical protein